MVCLRTEEIEKTEKIGPRHSFKTPSVDFELRHLNRDFRLPEFLSTLSRGGQLAIEGLIILSSHTRRSQLPRSLQMVREATAKFTKRVITARDYTYSSTW